MVEVNILFIIRIYFRFFMFISLCFPPCQAGGALELRVTILVDDWVLIGFLGLGLELGSLAAYTNNKACLLYTSPSPRD